MIGPAVEVDSSGLSTWLNDAYMFAVDELVKANPDYFTKAATASTVTDQQEYDLPTDFEKAIKCEIQIDGIWKNVKPLQNFNGVPVISQTDSSQGFDWGQPYYYIIGDNIGFMPIPDETTSNNIKLWYQYTPEELEEDSDAPVIPAKYHHIIKYGAYANYLDQDDEHVAAENMRRRFERRVEQMVENLYQNQANEPRSVEITHGTDLYFDGEDYV